MPIELVTAFRPFVDELFTKEACYNLVTNQFFSWSGAHSVKVYKISTSAMTDYARDGETGSSWSRYGAVASLDATTEEFTLTQDRSFTFAIDKMDTDETARQLAAASALARQIREVVIPEMDTYIFGKICADAGETPTAKAVTKDNIFDMIIDANNALDDKDVPTMGRVLIVTPTVYAAMKRSKDIVMNTDIGADMRLKGVISNIDGVDVVRVPGKRLPEKFGFLLVHPSATVAPVKLADYKVHQDPPGLSGSLVEGRLYYDAFVLENKIGAIYYQAQP